MYKLAVNDKVCLYTFTHWLIPLLQVFILSKGKYLSSRNKQACILALINLNMHGK